MDSSNRLPWKRLALVLVALFCAAVMAKSSYEAQVKTMWVAVAEDSPDAVLLDEPDRWAEPVATLKFNERVQILRTLSERSSNPLPFYKIKVRGFEGYVKSNVLAEESQLQGGGDAEAKVAVGVEAANTAAKGLNRSAEGSLRKEDPNFDARVKEVEAMEAAVDELIFGGTGDKADPAKAYTAYRSFGDEGELLAREEPTKEEDK